MTGSESDPLRAAVVGGGMMGAGIAHVLAVGGADVALYDPDDAALRTAVTRIETMARLLEQDPAKLSERVIATTDLVQAVRGASFVVEAGPEVLAVKREIFKSLSELTSSQAVLASNTSAIPIREIAAGLANSARILGTHFWHPPQLVPLVEVVQSDATDPAAVSWTIDLLSSCGLEPVRIAADVPGFVGNRLQHALKREAIALVAAGVCDAETLDTVVKAGFGLRLGVLGPLEQADLGGLDLTHKIHTVVMPALDNTPFPHPYLQAKVDRGEIGAKVGKGFREWGPGEAAKLRETVDAFLLEAAHRRARQNRPQATTKAQ